MKTAVVCLVRLENDYLQEWKSWYKNLGFTNVILYDNNREGEDSVIEDDFTIIQNWKERSGYTMQNEAYQDAYNKYSKQFDWIAFFDADEFLELDSKYGNIEEFLSQDRFREIDEIKFSWKQYGNNNQIYTDASRGVQDRFKSDTNIRQASAGTTKCILRGGQNYVFHKHQSMNGHHGANIIGVRKCVNVLGQEVDKTLPYAMPIYVEAWINHYSTKSLQEYIQNKGKRGAPEKQNYYNLEIFRSVNPQYSMEELTKLAGEFN